VLRNVRGTQGRYFEGRAARDLVGRAGGFLKTVQRGVDDADVLLEHGTEVFDADPTPSMHPAFMQKTLTVFAHFLQCRTIFKSNVAGNDVFNGLGHNHSPHAYRTSIAIKSKIFPAR